MASAPLFRLLSSMGCFCFGHRSFMVIRGYIYLLVGLWSVSFYFWQDSKRDYWGYRDQMGEDNIHCSLQMCAKMPETSSRRSGSDWHLSDAVASNHVTSLANNNGGRWQFGSSCSCFFWRVKHGWGEKDIFLPDYDEWNCYGKKNAANYMPFCIFLSAENKVEIWLGELENFATVVKNVLSSNTAPTFEHHYFQLFPLLPVFTTSATVISCCYFVNCFYTLR